MRKNREKLFYNKGLFLDTEEEKDGYKSKEEVNIKIIPKFRGPNLIKFIIRLSFDYDIYSLSECVIDRKAFNYLKKESGWDITMEDLLIEIQTYFEESQQKNPPTTIKYLVTPSASYMYFTQHTKHQSIAVFTLIFHDAEPEDAYQNASIRINDIKKDVKRMEQKKAHLLKYLDRVNPVLLKEVQEEIRLEDET